MTRSVPIGYIAQCMSHDGMANLILGDGGQWFNCDGQQFDAAKYPRLALVLELPRPRLSWRRPVSSWRKLQAWKAGDRMAYGGTPTCPRVPDLRARPVPPQEQS